MKIRKAFVLFLISIQLILFTPAAASAGSEESATRNGIYFDTAISILIYGEDAETLADDCMELCARYEMILSARKEGSELYRVNHRTGASVQISDELKECLEKALYYCELSDGALDISIFPVSSLWDFHASEPVLPDADLIEAELPKVDFRKVRLDGNVITFDSPDTMLDPGAVAKGYISAKLAEYLEDNGVTSALINLGGNVRAVGRKPNGSNWKIGLQKPFADRGEVLAVEEIDDRCVISSGTYERYFTIDGTQYHHILDPVTGWPSRTDYTQVSIVGDDDEACDALATIAFIAGKEKTLEIIREAGLSVRVTATYPDERLEVWTDETK